MKFPSATPGIRPFIGPSPRTRTLVVSALLGLTWTGCGDSESKSATSALAAERIGHALVSEAVNAGQVTLDLGGAVDDPTVVADARDLLVNTLTAARGRDARSEPRIDVRYLGKGALGGEPKGGTNDVPGTERGADASERSEAEETTSTAVAAFNPVTQNEFRLEVSREMLSSLGQRAAALGLDRASSPEPTSLPGPLEGARSWSNSDDSRYRVYGVNAPVTNANDRRIVHLGGCTGTLVGPRHVVTAGHCLWNRNTQTWSNNFRVRAGRNGTWNAGEVLVDSGNVPAGQALWYYTPAQYRATSGSTWGYDYGILVLPARLGDATGWMGRVALSHTKLAEANIYRRGYPACNATMNGQPRVDEPNPCTPAHLYAAGGTCSLGEYQSQDSDGWSRVVHHSCDASGGDSGSPLYLPFDGGMSVTAVHFSSRCGAVAGSTCTGSQVARPLAALRLTPEYRDLIAYFRETFP